MRKNFLCIPSSQTTSQDYFPLEGYVSTACDSTLTPRSHTSITHTLLLNLRFNAVFEVAYLDDLLLQLSGHVLLLDFRLPCDLFVEESVKDQV